MTHAYDPEPQRGPVALCGLYPGTWPIGDNMVLSPQNAMDPVMLKITCPECLAVLHRDLMRG